MTDRRRFTTLLASALAASALPARAQTFPARPVPIIVPFAAGGAVDIVARTIADRLAQRWGQQPVIENRPGAGGIVASQALVRAAPDGHTLMVVANGHPLNPFFHEKLPYDTERDFTPITQIGASPLVISVPPGETARDAKAFFEAAKAKPDGIVFGVSGFGTSAHLAGVLASQVTGAKLVAVPHRSGSQALQTVMTGGLPMSINPLLEVIELARAGKVRPLAVTTAARSAILPDVPTMAEQGYAGFDTGVWWGVVAPGGLAPDMVLRLSRDLTEAIRSPEATTRLQQLGATPVGSSPEAFRAFLASEGATWGPVIRSANIRLE
jgi:tripartite-type tricarboxylate transporter receptor subunit TctC